jgi:hypothetical protein
MIDPDRDGFDPFREEYPAHEVKSVQELLPKDFLRAWEPGDPPKPEPQQVKCGVCFKDFMSKAAWFNAKWRFSSLCKNCADGNRLPPGFLAECKRPPVRQMECPRCGIRRGVDAVLLYNLWHYESNCLNCGERVVACYRLRRACAECGEEFFVSENRPLRVCAKCRRNASTKNPYS